MHQAMHGKIVSGMRVAGGAAAGRIGRVDELGRARRRIRARLGAGKAVIVVGARAGDMHRAPDLDGPIDRTQALIEHRAQLDRRRRAQRRSEELVLAREQDADRPAGHARGDIGGVEGDVVGAVLAVAARPLAMEHGDLVGRQVERLRQPVAQHIDALRVRPHLEMAVDEFGQRAGRADRRIGEERPRKARLDDASALDLRRRAGLDHPVTRLLRLEPGDVVHVGGHRFAAVPDRAFARRLRCPRHRRLVVRREGDEVAVAQDLDRPAGRAPHRRFVERGETGAAPGPAQDARMQHIVGDDVVHERGARDLVRQVEPRHVSADDAVLRRQLGRRAAGRRTGEIDLARERPVVEPAILCRRAGCARRRPQARRRRSRASRRRGRRAARAPRRRPAARRRRSTRSCRCRW